MRAIVLLVTLLVLCLVPLSQAALSSVVTLNATDASGVDHELYYIDFREDLYEGVVYNSESAADYGTVLFKQEATNAGNIMMVATNYSYLRGHALIAGASMRENMGGANVHNASYSLGTIGLMGMSNAELTVTSTSSVSPYDIQYQYSVSGANGGAGIGAAEVSNTGKTYAKTTIMDAKQFTLSGEMSWSVPKPAGTIEVPDIGIGNLCVWEQKNPTYPVFPGIGA
ncbi:MAG: hypothetical protein DRI26_00020 [Chloroflexi bacterium]|nr:MAG: hypothetical protein DRI26_00020 [Chloroflexota bacterium]